MATMYFILFKFLESKQRQVDEDGRT